MRSGFSFPPIFLMLLILLAFIALQDSHQSNVAQLSADQLIAQQVGYSLPKFDQSLYWVYYSRPNNYFADSTMAGHGSRTYFIGTDSFPMNVVPNQFTGFVFDGGVLVNPPHDSTKFYFQLSDSSWAWLPAYAVTYDFRLTERWRDELNTLLYSDYLMSIYAFIDKAACTLPLPSSVTQAIIGHIYSTTDSAIAPLLPAQPKDLLDCQQLYRIMSAYTDKALRYQDECLHTRIPYQIGINDFVNLKPGDTLTQYTHHFMTMIDYPIIMVVEQGFGDSVRLRTIAPNMADLYEETSVATWDSRFSHNLDYLALKRASRN